MNVKETVREAWQLTQSNLRRLIWYGFIPAFFGVIVSSVYLTYQYNALRHSTYFSGSEQFDYSALFSKYWGLASENVGLSILLVVVALLIVAGNYLLPPVFKGTLISRIQKLSRQESLEGSREVGIRHFFPLFEFSIVTGAFSINTLFTESSFIFRWWGDQLLFLALPVLLFIAMAGLIINFLFTYAEYFIVLEDKGLIRAIMDSSVLVVSNMRKTILVFVLMLLIGARIILNVVLVLLIPMLVVFLTTYFATIFLSTFGLIMIGLVGLIILVISSYLLGLFQIFATAVWVLTFEELLKHREQVATPSAEGEA